jgi:hypothetical protein
MFNFNRLHILTGLLSSLLATKIPAVASHSTILTNPVPTSPTFHQDRTTKCNPTDVRKAISQSRKAHAPAQGATNPAAAATPTLDLALALVPVAARAPASSAKSKNTLIQLH